MAGKGRGRRPRRQDRRSLGYWPAYPPLDPSRLTGEDRATYVEELNQDPMRPWLNRALRAFPPGSTFKVVTGVAALESGAIGADEVYNATGYHKYGKRDWTVTAGAAPGGARHHRRGHGPLDQRLLLGDRPPASDRRDRGDRRLGPAARFGEPTGIPLGENGRNVRARPDARSGSGRSYREPWYEAETMDVVIGQGFLQVTPLQLARVYLASPTRACCYPSTWSVRSSRPRRRGRRTSTKTGSADRRRSPARGGR